MNEWTVAFPVLALFVGFLLNEVSQRFRNRRQHKGALGRAIADLLEIRHQALAVSTIIRELQRRYKIPNQVIPSLMVGLNSILPKYEVLQDRYNKAVDVISETDPILAFQLRSKDVIQPMFSYLRLIGSGDALASTVFEKIETDMMPRMLKVIEDTLLQVAFSHRLKTWWNVRKVIQRKDEAVPPELESMLSNIDSLLREHGVS